MSAQLLLPTATGALAGASGLQIQTRRKGSCYSACSACVCVCLHFNACVKEELKPEGKDVYLFHFTSALNRTVVCTVYNQHD